MVRRPTMFTLVEQFWHNLPGGTAAATEHVLRALAEFDEFDLVGLAAAHGRSGRHDPLAVDRLPPGMAVHHHRLPRPALYEGWIRTGWPSVDRAVGRLAVDSEAPRVCWASSMIVPATSHPVVATVHDVDFLHHPEHLTPRGRDFFPRMWDRARRRADLIVCPSQIVADDLRGQGVEPDRIAVVALGVGQPLCDDDEAAELVAAMGVPAEFVLWVGPLMPRKNPRGAARAMAAVDLDLVVVGASVGRGDQAGYFTELGPRVHRLPSVSDLALSALYRRARALLFPSLKEGFGLPVLEAMAHGTPVVTSAGTATEEVAGGAALVVDPSDHDGIGEALVQAVEDSDLRRRLVDDGLARAAQLPWSNTAKGYAELFRSVLER